MQQIAMQQTVTVQPILPYIRVVLGIILGLSITTLLKGIATVIEHPRRYGWSLLHMSWVLWALVSIVTLWWWEFSLSEVPSWTFGAYLFEIAYCSAYFLLASLLFPTDVREFAGYEDYLLHRRRWFFGVVAVILLLDVIDTGLKGAEHWRRLGAAYPLRTAAMLAIAALGATSTNRRLQLALGLIALVSSVGYYAWRYFSPTAA
jgi:hypothetical protein